MYILILLKGECTKKRAIFDNRRNQIPLSSFVCMLTQSFVKYLFDKHYFQFKRKNLTDNESMEVNSKLKLTEMHILINDYCFVLASNSNNL